MYEPQWEKPDTLIESSKHEQVNQVSGQLVDGQVLKKIENKKSSFLAHFLLGCVVTFTIMFVVKKYF